MHRLPRDDDDDDHDDDDHDDPDKVGGPSPSSPLVCIDCLNPWTGPYLCPKCGWPLCDTCGQVFFACLYFFVLLQFLVLCTFCG